MTITNQTSQGLAGINIFDTSTEQKFAVGTRVSVTYGSSKNQEADAIYVKAGGDRLAGYVNQLQITSAAAYVLGSAQTKTTAAALATAQGQSFLAAATVVDLASGDYGWAFVRGVIPMNIAASCVTRARIGLTATAGRVDDADTDYELLGAYSIDTIGGTAGIFNVIATRDLVVYRNAA